MPRRLMLARLVMLFIGALSLNACAGARPPREPGDLRWSIGVAHPSAPLAGGGLVYLAGEQGVCLDGAGTCPARILALDEANGALRWERADQRATRSARFILRDGVLYAGLRGNDAQTLLALNAADGRERWRHDGLALTLEFVVTDRLVFAPDQALDGTAPLLLLDRETGARLKPPALSSPLTALTGDDAGVYAMLRDGHLIALDPASGTLRWETPTRFDLAYHADQRHAIRLEAQPGALIVQTQPVNQLISEIEVYSSTSGERRWTAPLQIPDHEPAPSANGLIYLRDITSTLLQAYDLETGLVRWSARVGRSPTNPVLDRHQPLIGASDGVSAYDAGDGTLIWGPLKIGPPRVAGGGVVYGTLDTAGVGELAFTTAAYAYTSESGRLRWMVEGPGDAYRERPVISGASAYLRTATRLYALGGQGGA